MDVADTVTKINANRSTIQNEGAQTILNLTYGSNQLWYWDQTRGTYRDWLCQALGS